VKTNTAVSSRILRSGLELEGMFECLSHFVAACHASTIMYLQAGVFIHCNMVGPGGIAAFSALASLV